MYLLAAQWLKTTGLSATGLARTFAIKLDLPEKSKPEKVKREKKKAKIVGLEKPKRDLSKVKCFACGKRGHYTNKYPDKEGGSNDVEQEIKRTFATWNDASTYITYQVFDAVQDQENLTVHHVLLDN